MPTAKGDGIRFIDGTNHPSARAVEAAGAQGVIMYIGSPASALGKDATSAQYQDYVVAGLERLFVYELGSNDISGGLVAGQQHAADAFADARIKGISMGSPIAAAIDEHVAAANIPLVIQYQTGFITRLKQLGWFGPVGVYGFPEVTIAVHANSTVIAQWYWGCGSLAAQPEFITIWQSNQGTVTIEGAQDDWDIEQINTLEELVTSPTPWVASYPAWTPEGDFLLNKAGVGATLSADKSTVSVTVTPDLEGLWTVNTYIRVAMIADEQLPTLTASNAGLLAAVQALAVNPAVTADQIQQMIDTAVAAHVQITGTVAISSTPPTPAS